MDKITVREGNPMAFPCDRVTLSDGIHSSIGMELRDYFAAKAMQAAMRHIFDIQPTKEGMLMPQAIAEMAYEYADAMLEVRNARS